MLANIDELSLAKTRNRMLVATKISEAMRCSGLNQKQLAEKMGKKEWASQRAALNAQRRAKYHTSG